MIYVGALLGRRYESLAARAGFAENRRFATVATGGRFCLEAGQMVEPAAATLMFGCRGESRGFFKLAGPLVVGLAKRRPERQLATSRPCLSRTRSHREC